MQIDRSAVNGILPIVENTYIEHSKRTKCNATGGDYETSPQTISASGRGRGRAASFVAIARAQAYPSRPVRIIVGFGAGGTPDINARLIAQWLSERLGQQFIIENRPGAGGNIAAEAAMRAPADGIHCSGSMQRMPSSATLYDKLNFNLIRDIAPVAGVTGGPQVMEVIPSFRRRQFRNLSPMPRPIRANQYGIEWHRKLEPCFGRTLQDDDGRGDAARALSVELALR